MNLKDKYYEEQYLKHHGIKGQKWGRRRFQNVDGSLTPAGQKRYNDSGTTEIDKSDHSISGDRRGRYTKNRDPGARDEQSAKGIPGRAHRNQEVGPQAANSQHKNSPIDSKSKGTNNREVGGKPFIDEPGDKNPAGNLGDKKGDGTADNLGGKKSDDQPVADNKTANKDTAKYLLNIKQTKNAVNDVTSGTQNATKGMSNMIDIIQDMQRKEKMRNSNVKVMSDAEIRSAINRMEMEGRYNQLKYGNEVDRGAEKAKAILGGIGSVVAVAGGIVTLALGIKQLKGN